MRNSRFPLKELHNSAFSGSEFFEDFFIDEVESTDAFFLGPKAENTPFLLELIGLAVKSIKDGRQSFHPEDNSAIEEKYLNKHEYKKSIELIKKNYSKLIQLLDTFDTPFYSHRYQGHMNWELTIPSIAAYFAAMLHNPNNVTVQASTATTYIELAVGIDICQMIGMASTKPTPWCHITCDGTIANIESVWSARELNYFPFAVKDAIINEDVFVHAKHLTVSQPNGNISELLSLSNWELFNITNDEILALPKRIAEICKLDEIDCWKRIIHNYSLNALGFTEFESKHKTGCQPSIVVPSTKHYSWSKAASVLGFGHGKLSGSYNKGLLNVFVDENARMDMDKLRTILDYCSNPDNNRPLMLLVAVMGSTEESAVDPLMKIIEIRDEYRKEKNFDFNIHADAAYGGYCLSAIRKNFSMKWPFEQQKKQKDDVFLDDFSKTPLSPYVIDQFKQIRHCDSVTIDPHKWAYVPYPAGSLTYRNGEMINLVSFGAPYIGDESSLPSVGGFGLEGSKPGASAASVFFSHSIIRPSVKGYGRIISNCLINAKLMYLSLLNLETENDNFFIVPLAKINHISNDEKETLKYINDNLHNKKHEHIFSQDELYLLFKDIGPDLNMVDYIFNFYTDTDNKIPNRDINKVNTLNQLIYDELHIH